MVLLSWDLPQQTFWAYVPQHPDSFSNCAVQVPVLGFFVQAATAAKEAAMGVYVQQQLEYGKLWKLVEFSQVGCHQHALQRWPPRCHSQLLQRR